MKSSFIVLQGSQYVFTHRTVHTTVAASASVAEVASDTAALSDQRVLSGSCSEHECEESLDD